MKHHILAFSLEPVWSLPVARVTGGVALCLAGALVAGCSSDADAPIVPGAEAPAGGAEDPAADPSGMGGPGGADAPGMGGTPDGVPAPVPEIPCQPGTTDITQFAAKPTTRRLSAQQYLFSMQALANDPLLELDVASDPAPEGNFELPSNLRVTREWVENVEKNSWQVAPAILNRMQTTLGCEPETDAACLDGMMDALSLEVWRRPLEEEERVRLTALAEKVKVEAAGESVAEAVIAAFLQAPQFAHTDDVPRGAEVAPGIRRMDDWQLAESLAMFFWRGLPDTELLDAAAAGLLSSPDGLSAQVERMIDHPNTARVTSHFVEQWLNIRRLELTNKDEGDWDDEMAEAVRRDTNEVFTNLMRDPSADMEDLFTHNTAYITPGNAELYDMTMAAGEPGKMVELTPEQRSGILTHSSFLTTYSKVTGTSAIRRGDMILKQMLCQHLELPADIVIPEEPKDDAAPTARERLAIHRDSPACSVCHTFMDPPGLALELWDGVGRARTTENGVMIDASGSLSVPGKEPQPFETPLEMFQLLASEPVVEGCFMERWFNEATGTADRASQESCGLDNITETLREGGGIPLRSLLAELTQHPSFWLRKEMAQ